MKIKIIHEDNHLLVVKKPVNVLSQSDITKDDDMLTILKKDLKERYNKPGNVYLGLLHRLDRPVGGVMVFAKTSKAASRISAQIRERSFNKTYLAVVQGNIKKQNDTLENYLLKDTKRKISRVVENETNEAKKAILEYSVLGKKDNFTLVRINLLTGRHHQIRVQFSAIGHPLIGDSKYGKNIKTTNNIALCAFEVSFIHPIEKKEVNYRCEPPNSYPFNLFQKFHENL